jgi:hypothetical protein
MHDYFYRSHYFFSYRRERFKTEMDYFKRTSGHNTSKVCKIVRFLPQISKIMRKYAKSVKLCEKFEIMRFYAKTLKLCDFRIIA